MSKQTWLKATMLVMLAGAAFGCAGRAYYARGVPPPPPYARAGVRGYAPGPGYVWVNSYYDWRGRWVYVPGNWMRPPRARAVWVPGRFEHRGGRQYWRGPHWR